jgi:hypothetical protein
MSTRCQVVLKQGEKELWFYRHSDGYPEGVLPSLTKFVDWVREGKLRDNIGQNAGWLVVLGHDEYGSPSPDEGEKWRNWKVGAYEPCPCLSEHGDIDYLYEVRFGPYRMEKEPDVEVWGRSEYGSEFNGMDMPKGEFVRLH